MQTTIITPTILQIKPSWVQTTIKAPGIIQVSHWWVQTTIIVPTSQVSVWRVQTTITALCIVDEFLVSAGDCFTKIKCSERKLIIKHNWLLNEDSICKYAYPSDSNIIPVKHNPPQHSTVTSVMTVEVSRKDRRHGTGEGVSLLRGSHREGEGMGSNVREGKITKKLF